MQPSPMPWKAIVLWGLALVAIMMAGAVIDATQVSGTCMFILVPYFAALAVAYPLLAANRFGAGILTYLPYAVIGFAPLYLFDWQESRALVGLWAVFLWAASGPLTGLLLDLANHSLRRLSQRVKAVSLGLTMQAVTFFVMLHGLTYLYVPSASAVGHLHFFSREWFFTLPWMMINGAFGGYTAYALQRARHARGRDSGL